MIKKTEINQETNKTVINSEIGQATVINSKISQSTVINQEIFVNENTSLIGTILADKYKIKDSLNVSTGEADLYLCEFENTDYVAKIYRRERAVKPEVISLLKSIKSEHIATLYDTGIYNNRPFEILTYYKNGSLQGRKFDARKLLNKIIPGINEALKVLHENHIFHKDLKPSNIMILDDKKSVALIDFGISSVVEQGNTVLVTKTGMTPEYTAPETFKNLVLEESDYYSFGITIYELFCGHTPYQNMSAEEIAMYTVSQKIPFPKDMPKPLQNLISGLTYYDITNRKSKNNPNRRWTYDEVVNWCAGKKQVIPGETTQALTKVKIPTYTFLGKPYNDIEALIIAIASNWSEGKKQLYRGLLSGFFKNFDPQTAGYCIDAEEEASKTSGKDDLIFWKLIYKICPNIDAFYWKEKSYENIPTLGRNMLEMLWSESESDFEYWDSILENKLLSEYLTRKKVNTNLALATTAIETQQNTMGNSQRDKIMNYYNMAYLLSGQKIFSFNGKQIKSVEELTLYMKSLLDSSYKEFENFCHKMIDYDETLNVRLESWLIALGKRNELDNWRNSLGE